MCIRDSFSVPVCTGFAKKIFEGQLCYSLNMSKLEAKNKYIGRENSLKLYLDVNKERESVSTIQMLNLTQDADNKLSNKVKIHFNTIHPFTGHGGGQYIITSVKQMTTTADFDNFPDDVKKCQNEESLDECSNKKILEGVVKFCGCLPGIFNSFQNVVEVRNNKSA